MPPPRSMHWVNQNTTTLSTPLVRIVSKKMPREAAGQRVRITAIRALGYFGSDPSGNPLLDRGPRSRAKEATDRVIRRGGQRIGTDEK